MTFRLILGCALLLLVSACVAGPYGERRGGYRDDNQDRNNGYHDRDNGRHDNHDEPRRYPGQR